MLRSCFRDWPNAVIVRKLEYLIALAREGHFARAAAVCNVSQPTLSAGIQQLEIEMGVLIVKRGQRYQGLTEEGERVLAWAQRMAAECERLREELRDRTGDLSGTLRLGAIPSALPLASALTMVFHEAHPRSSLRVFGLTPSEIQHGFEEFTLDAGITNLDGKVHRYSHTHPLYVEEYVLLSHKGAKPAGKSPLTPADLRSIPICILTSEMHTTGAAFREVFGEPWEPAAPHIETNSLTTAEAWVRSGAWSAIVPASRGPGSGSLADDGADFEITPLQRAGEPRSVGIAVPHREPASLVAAAFFEVATSEKAGAAIRRLLPGAPGPARKRAR